MCPAVVVLLTSNLLIVLMAAYHRRAVSQGIHYICVPPQCFRSSLKLYRSRNTAVNAFAYINVLIICYAPLCVVIHINHLKTKRRLLYLKTQFVPRSKHFSSRL